MKQVDVSIMGQAYRLSCPPGGEAALTQAVAAVDREMCAIRDAGKVRARERIAVLAALNLAFQLAQPSRTAAWIDARPQAEGGDVPDLSDLLRRLDQALAADGNLL
ncbi:cell division protein ZapA [Inhella gelatinilytica]|uniref:Cell division protein ZapA n=1 Tax=Inhella gelatinilytica TaxID=2795030 RepID=A0A931NEL1_9BURK|nr:cell division protein ZapA [Inhella gelatinilytica]MBH9553804.1 cell division protein ZapA [Inhella gelatinilytica]